MLITSTRCWILRPDGPAAIHLENERKMAAMSKCKPRDRGVQVATSGIGGGEQLGSLSLIICQVDSLLRAISSERRVWHAFPYMYVTSLANFTAYSKFFFGDLDMIRAW